MIKLKDIISESSSVKLNSNIIKGVEFNARGYGSSIVFTPKSIKHSEMLDESGLAPYEIQAELVKYCENKLKGFKFTPDYRYPGAGYAVEMDMDSLINKL